MDMEGSIPRMWRAVSRQTSWAALDPCPLSCMSSYMQDFSLCREGSPQVRYQTVADDRTPQIPWKNPVAGYFTETCHAPHRCGLSMPRAEVSLICEGVWDTHI